MTQEKLKIEEDARRFLLGRMTDAERADFEREFLSEDGDSFDVVCVVEDELIEAFHRGLLSADDRKAFAAEFLESRVRHRRVRLHGELLRRLDAERDNPPAVEARAGFFASLVGLFAKPQFALGAMAAVILIAAIVLIVSLRDRDGEIVKVETPSPVVSASPSGSPPAIAVPAPSVAPPMTPTAAANTTATPSPTTKASPEKPARPVVATLVLLPGLSRSSGATGQLSLGPETKSVRLRLNLESRDYQHYRAEIADQDGNVIARTGKLTARALHVDASFSASGLRSGDYLVKLYGFAADGSEEPAADYQMRVNRK